MLDINASAEGVFVFISNPQCFFHRRPPSDLLSGPTTPTILAAGRLPAPVSASALVDSIDKAARPARCVSEIAAIFD
jgi:hypothetical protein